MYCSKRRIYLRNLRVVWYSNGLRLKSIITRVTNAICDTLDNINFPEDWNTVKEGFYRISNFPNIVGAIDGTFNTDSRNGW